MQGSGYDVMCHLSFSAIVDELLTKENFNFHHLVTYQRETLNIMPI